MIEELFAILPNSRLYVGSGIDHRSYKGRIDGWTFCLGS
jgi:hypothetical protein